MTPVSRSHPTANAASRAVAIGAGSLSPAILPIIGINAQGSGLIA